MAKSVADIALLFNVLAGLDDEDLASVDIRADAPPPPHDYLTNLSRNFDGLKLGVLGPWYFLAEENVRGDYGAQEVCF